MKKIFLALLTAPLLLSAAPKDLVDLQVYPKDAHLVTLQVSSRSCCRPSLPIALRAMYPRSQVHFANPALVKFENNIIKPVADGETELKIEFGGRTLTVPVKVENAARNGHSLQPRCDAHLYQGRL